MSDNHSTAQLVPFQYEGASVRTVVIDGEPWFVLADLCKALGLTNASVYAERLRVIGEVTRLYPIADSLGRAQQATIVSEAGMYEVVIRSDKPEAVNFRRWITAEVLPTIRRTGSYGAAPALTDDEVIHRALQITNRRVEALTAKVNELAPKAGFYDDLMDADGAYSMLATAKILGWGRNVLMRDLRRLGVLQGNNLPYQRYEHHFKVVPGTYVHPRTGQRVPTATTFVLPAGLDFLRRKLAGLDVVA